VSDNVFPAGRLARGGAALVALYLVLPILVVLPISLTDQRFLSLPVRHLSLQHYQALLASPAWWSAIGQSAGIALAAATLASLIGTLAAIGTWRLASRLAEAARVAMMLPIVIPSIVYAVGLYRWYAELGLLDSFTGVTLAHAVTAVPYPMITVAAALAAMDRRLEQAARGLGASRWQTLRWVILPRIVPGIASGAIFAFIHSWDELVIVLFIASRTVFTLPRKIWDGINENLDPVMAAVAVLLIAATIVLMALHATLTRRGTP
jgi:putative spermidine/putrescine transport system permease protein